MPLDTKEHIASEGDEKKVKELSKAVDELSASINKETQFVAENTEEFRKNAKEQEKLKKLKKDRTYYQGLDNQELIKETSRARKENSATKKRILELEKELKENDRRQKGGIFSKFGKTITDAKNGDLKNAKGTIAIFAGAAYGLKKLESFNKTVENTAVNFAKFRIAEAALSLNSLVAPGGIKQLEELRDNLNLTREQFAAFSSVLQDAAANGVKSTAELGQAAEQLKNTFGGDQTERLKGYVQLLKEIPTIDTDLNINANIDDQTAAYFALASKGQVQQTIELQSAGLLGGADDSLDSKKSDTELINNAAYIGSAIENLTAKTTEFFYLKELPIISGVFTVLDKVAEGVFGTVALLVDLAAVAGQYSSSSQIAEVTAAEERAAMVAELHAMNAELGIIAEEIAVQNAEIGARGGAGISTGATAAGATSYLPFVALAVGAAYVAFAGIRAYSDSKKTSQENYKYQEKSFSNQGLTESAKEVRNESGGKKEPIDEQKLKNEKIALKSIKALNAQQKIQLKKLQESALALQYFINATENAAKTAKVALYEFGQEVANVDIGTFSEIGGSIQNFENALDVASKNIAGKFEIVGKTLDVVRTNITKNTKLTGEQRDIALDKVKVKQLEAARKFVSEQIALIGEFDKVPEIIQAKLSQKLDALKLDVGTKSSSLSFGEIADNINRQLDASLTAFKSSKQIASGKDNKLTSGLANEIDKSNTGINDSILKGIKDLNKDDFSGLEKTIADELQIVATDLVQNGNKNEKSNNETLEGIRKKIDEGIKENEKSLPNSENRQKASQNLGEETDLSNNFKEKQNEIKKKNAEIINLTPEHQESKLAINVPGGFTGKGNDLPIKHTLVEKKGVRADEARSQVQDKQEEIAKLQEESNQIQKEISEKRLKNYEILKGDTDLVSKISDVESKKVILEAAQSGDLEKQRLAGDILIKESENQIKISKDKSKNLIALRSIETKTATILDKGVALTQATTKSATGLLENLSNFIDIIDLIKEEVEKSSETQGAKRQLGITQAALGYQSLIGKAVEANIAESSATSVLYKTELDQIILQKGQLQDIKDKVANNVKFFEDQTQTFKEGLNNSQKGLENSGLKDQKFDTHDVQIKQIYKPDSKDGDTISVNIQDFISKAIEKANNLAFEKEEELNGIDASLSKQDHDLKADEITKEYAKEFNKISDGLSKVSSESGSKEAKETVTRLNKKISDYNTGLNEITSNIQKNFDLNEEKFQNVMSSFAANIIKTAETSYDVIAGQLNVKSFSKQQQASESQQQVSGSSFDFGALNQSTNKSLDAAKNILDITTSTINENAERVRRQVQGQVENKFNANINPLQDKVNNGTATEEDKTNLLRFQKEKEIEKIDADRLANESKIEAKARAELKYKEDVVRIAATERELRNAPLESRQGFLEKKESFQVNTGASPGQIIATQREQLGLEALQLENFRIEKEILDTKSAELDAEIALAKTRGDNADLILEKEKQANTLKLDAYRKGQEYEGKVLDLRQKAIGKQRDAFEKFLGHAFGSLSTGVGLRKNVTSDAALFGQNRVQLSSGLIKKGGSTSIDERQAAYAQSAGGTPIGYGLGNNEGTTNDTAFPSRAPIDKVLSGGKFDRSTLGSVTNQALAGLGNPVFNRGNLPNGTTSFNSTPYSGISGNNGIKNKVEQNVKVEVDVNVKFNNDMFEEAVGKIVRTLVKTDSAIKENLDGRYVNPGR